jgi:hypothetical protein
MNIKVHEGYFGDKTLAGFTYVFQFKKMTDNQRIELSRRIVYHGGVFIFNLENHL